jgi:hypothetical protein
VIRQAGQVWCDPEVEKADERLKAIGDLHIGAIQDKQSSLIVAPMHVEARRNAGAVRKKLRDQGIYGL